MAMIVQMSFEMANQMGVRLVAGCVMRATKKGIPPCRLIEIIFHKVFQRRELASDR